MKRLFIILAAAVMAVGIAAQEVYPTKFLGIPIDGTKEEMIHKIQAKGFVYDREHDCLEGEFNGTGVNVFVVTNGNKVWRIMVAEKTTFSESEIRLRFNNLFRQFQKNKRYITLNKENPLLPENEDISYEMLVNNKRYSREFLQITHEIDTTFLFNAMIENLESTAQQNGVDFSLDKLSPDELSSLFEPFFNMACLYAFEKNPVWFLINEYRGKYHISIYYDNEYNKADGEDL